MWAGGYLALFALAAGATYLYAVEEEAVFFTTAIAAATWSLLAIYATSIDVVSEGVVETVGIGAGQYLLGGLSLLSFFAFIGSVMGWYPDDPEIHDEEYAKI